MWLSVHLFKDGVEEGRYALESWVEGTVMCMKLVHLTNRELQWNLYCLLSGVPAHWIWQVLPVLKSHMCLFLVVLQLECYLLNKLLLKYILGDAIRTC